MHRISEFQKRIYEKIKQIQEEASLNSESTKTKPKKAETEVPENKIYLDIKSTTIIKIVVIVILMYYVWSLLSQLHSLLLSVLVSLILSAAITPIVNKLQSYKIPRALSIIIIYLLILSFIFFLITALVPLAITQLTNLATFIVNLLKDIQKNGIEGIPYINYITPYVDKARLATVLQDTLNSLAKNVGNLTSSSLTYVTSIFSNILSIAGYAVVVFCATFFMIIDENAYEKFVLNIVPKKSRYYFEVVGKEIAKKLGDWLRGQLLLSFTLGVIAYLFMSIIGSKYAFTIAMITALTEFIPVIGPYIAAVPAVVLSLSQNLTLGLVALIGYLIIHTLEANVIAPMIMKKSVGLNPLVVILGMLTGYHLIGPLGIFLAVPVSSALMVIIHDYVRRDL